MTENREPCSECEVAAALAYYAEVADKLGLNGTSVWQKASEGEIDVREAMDFLKVVRAKADGENLTTLEELDSAMSSGLPQQLRYFRECVLAGKEEGFEEAVRRCREGQTDDNSES